MALRKGVSLNSLDTVAAVVVAWQESVTEDSEKVEVRDTSERVHTTSLHVEWPRMSWTSLFGRDGRLQGSAQAAA